jgi:putative nucleotidyltransferase with HDIG domain
MSLRHKTDKGAIEHIKYRIKTLNRIFVLVVFVLILLIFRFMHETVNYLPASSLIFMTSMIAVLLFIGFFLTWAASKKAVGAITEYSRKLNALIITTRNMQEIDHSDMLIENIMDVSAEMANAEGGSLLLSEGDSLVFKTVMGSKAGKLEGFSIPKSSGIAGWVVDNGSAVRVASAKDDDRYYPNVDEKTGHVTRSILCVPLKTGSGTIGALELVNKKNGAFTSEDEELLQYFADLSSMSIEKTRLYEMGRNFEIHITNILVEAIDSLSGKYWHSKRVARYSLIIADAANMPEEDKKRLYRASLLHDIGFLKIRPDEISSINDYKSHSQIGFEMLRPINFYDAEARIILHHHERYDGKGYPAGLKGDAIPIESRIIAIAEAFDAMVSSDSYKKAAKLLSDDVIPSIVEFNHAIEELRNNSGTQFDSRMVEAFVNNINEEHLNLE